MVVLLPSIDQRWTVRLAEAVRGNARTWAISYAALDAECGAVEPCSGSGSLCRSSRFGGRGREERPRSSEFAATRRPAFLTPCRASPRLCRSSGPLGAPPLRPGSGGESRTDEWGHAFRPASRRSIARGRVFLRPGHRSLGGGDP